MAFHPYPQVIAAVFNRRAFGPPRGLTPASACPRIAHPASRPRRGTQVALLRLAFAPAPFRLTSPRASDSLAHSTKGTPSQLESCSDCSWAHGFRYCFTPLSGCFSPFPHGTGSLSVSREYLALPDGPGRFTQNSSCSALLRILLCFDNIRIRNCHALWSFFPESSSPMSSCNDVVLQPRSCRNMNGLGYSPFARHYWGNHCYFLFLQVLRCFSSLR